MYPSSLLFADEDRENVTFNVGGVEIKTRSSHIFQTPDTYWIKDDWNSRQDGRRDSRIWGYNLKDKLRYNSRKCPLFVDCQYSYFSRFLDFFRYGILDIQDLDLRIMERVAIDTLGLGNI